MVNNLKNLFEEKFTVKYKDEDYEYQFIKKTNFEDLNNINNVSGIFFDEMNNVCIVDCEHDGNWTLVGGGKEEGETSDEAMYRETEEEADLNLEELKRLGYYKITKNDKVVEYHTKYAARIKNIKKQTINPDEGIISKRKFVSEEEFLHIFNRWKNMKFLLNKAIEKTKN